MSDHLAPSRPDRAAVTGPISRRAFLVRAANVGLGVTAAGMLGVKLWRDRTERPWDPSAFPPPGDARVAAVRVASYEADLEGIVLDGLRSIEVKVTGRSVLLKPNLVEYQRRTVVNTDPRLIAATVLAMRRLGARSVVVAEGPGHRRDTQTVVEASGLHEALASVEAQFVDLNAAPLVRRRLRSRYTDLEQLWLPQPVVDAEVVVSMPKMKTHHWVGVTLSLKNCFGCLPGRVYGWPKNVLHWAGIGPSILDVAGAVRPSLAIVDGIVGMQGNGPIQGSPVDAGVLVFGSDPVSTDVTAVQLMGLDPGRVPYLREASRFLGQGDPDRIQQVGEEPLPLSTNFAVPPGFESLQSGSAARLRGEGIGEHVG
ncbi:MAG: DUF362 domain-containing protein [Candidatus Velamenicoccus archaeovorus]